MSLNKLKALVGEEIYNQHIAPKLEGKEYFFAEGKDFVPVSRLNEVNSQKKELETQLASRDAQLTELQKAVKGNEELTAKIQELQTSNVKAKEEYEGKILQLQKDYALDSIITKANAKNSNALKGMLDLSKCEFKDGAYVGLDEQIAQIKKDNSWLFNETTPQRGGYKHPQTNPNNDEFAGFRNL